jgi:O-antigen chain-terminating methyltransferase
VLELAYRKLRPGAPFVLETINPSCWMAFFECYIRDLTHARPLHPDTLRYLVQASGFRGVNVEYRQPVTDADRLDSVAVPAADDATAPVAAAINAHARKLNARLFSSMDYAVIARR